MWSLEEFSRARGRVSDSKPSVLREYSHSPLRGPRELTKTAQGFLGPGSPEVYSSDSYFPLPDTSPTGVGETTSATIAYKENATFPDHDDAVPNARTFDPEVLELWMAYEEAIKGHTDSTATPPERNPLPKDGVMTADVTSEFNDPKVPIDSLSDAFVLEDVPATYPTSDPLYSKSSLPSKGSSISSRLDSNVVPDPCKSIFSNAKASSVRFLQSLVNSPKVQITNSETGEVYLKSVSLHMLQHFCGTTAISGLSYDNIIHVPPTHASRDGVIHVIRHMRRCCQGLARRPTGRLRTPPSIKEGIATSLACRFFYLNADAEHLEKLVVQDFMGSPRFFVTDEDVELIWCGYEETLRETALGDAVLWFVLEQVMSGTHALADEVRWLLEQEEFEGLKARAKEELKRAEWRSLGREAFLAKCLNDRKNRVTADGSMSVHEGKELLHGGGAEMDKPLPRLPTEA